MCQVLSWHLMTSHSAPCTGEETGSEKFSDLPGMLQQVGRQDCASELALLTNTFPLLGSRHLLG